MKEHIYTNEWEKELIKAMTPKKSILIISFIVQSLKIFSIRGNEARVNPFNPLSYIFLSFYLITLFIFNGVYGFKEFENPFNWVIFR